MGARIGGVVQSSRRPPPHDEQGEEATHTPMEVKSGPKRKIQAGAAPPAVPRLRRGTCEAGPSPSVSAVAPARGRPAVPLVWGHGVYRSGAGRVKARLARGEDVFLLDVREPDEVEAWAYPSG